MLKRIWLIVKTYIPYWVGIGAASGALISGWEKTYDISTEGPPVYRQHMIERPIRCVYHISRVAAAAGWGAFIGGATAATAPISIPLYMYWKNSDKEVTRNA